MNSSNKKISFVIPCYNSEKTIGNVIRDIENTINKNDTFEIVCVNDCSTDGVFDELSRIANKDKNVKVISFSKNVGQHNALLCGFRFVTGNVIVCIDDDGQTDPKQCYKLINELNKGYDIVFAKYPHKKHNLFRNFGTLINKYMGVWLCDLPYNIDTNSYFVCKRFVIDEVVKYHNPYTYVSGLLFRVTKNVSNVDIEHKERKEGKSGYTLKKLFSLWLNGFTAFSVKPLRIATILGFFIAFLGFLYGIILIIQKFIDPIRQLGYSSIMCAILFIGGIILIMLGLIGEYIGRIYICINNSPQYVIKETINIE